MTAEAFDRANYEGVSSEWLHDHGAEAAARFTEQGLLRINGLVSAATCHALRLHVDGCLVEARAAAGEGEGADSSDVFGDVHAAGQRWDMYLALEAPVLLMLREAATKLFPALAELLSDETWVCELSSLISDGGSARQPLHSDTTWQVGLPPLVTCFIALQDIKSDMGPTIMVPRTHTDATAHERLSGRPEMPAREASLGAMHGTAATAAGLKFPVMQCTINEGDCVMMDSRLFHCGGSNTSGLRRRLAYFSLHAPGILPGGPDHPYSMLPQYKGKLRLHRSPPVCPLDPARLKLFAEYSEKQQQKQQKRQQASNAVQAPPSLGGGDNLKASAKKRKASKSLVRPCSAIYVTYAEDMSTFVI